MRRVLPALLVALLAAPVMASADPIDFLGMGKNQTVTVAGLRNVTVHAGELTWRWMGATPSGWTPNFYTYCVDLLHNLVDGQNVDVKSSDDMVTRSEDGGRKAAWLYNRYAERIHGSEGTSAMAAGLQVAIWESLYDDGFNLNRGNFRLTDSSWLVAYYAERYLGALARARYDGYDGAKATWLDTGRGQDQIAPPVPEPATLLLLGSGVAALAARRRRKTNKGLQVA